MGPCPVPNKPVILVSRRLPDAVEDRLRRDYAPVLNPQDQPYDPDNLATRAGETGAQGLIVTPTDRLSAPVIAALPAWVEILATFSVGFEHIDLAAARARGLVVTNTPGVLTDATADIALLLILAAARRASEGERLLRAGRWTGWAPTQLMGCHLGGRRLGILGMGRIGRALATRARALGMVVHYHNRHRLPPEHEGDATFHDSVDSLLAVSDVLSLHCPATPQTRHLLNAARLALLPEGAIVVNTARGSVIDDDALIAALTTGRVAAAGLDVYDGEPQIPPGYLSLPNTVLLPHLGSATVETRCAMGYAALDCLDAHFRGDVPPHRVA